MQASSTQTYTSRLQEFYGHPALFIPSQQLNATSRIHLIGKINMHDFEAVAEPWRDQHHLLVIPEYLLKQLWIDEDSTIELSFIASATVPRPQLPPNLQRIFKENPDYAHAFDELSVSDQLQYLAWIASAPSPHEHEQRIKKTIHHVRSELKLGEEYHLLSDPKGYLA